MHREESSIHELIDFIGKTHKVRVADRVLTAGLK